MMGTLAFVPLITGLFLNGFEEMVLQGGKFYVLAAFFYLSCAGFYAVGKVSILIEERLTCFPVSMAREILARTI